MASKQLLNQASEHFADLSSMTRDQLRGMQKTPIGTEERSPQQEAAIWRKLRQLPAHHFNRIMDEAATKSGHKNNESKPCDTCAFILKHASREGKRAQK